LTLLVSCAGARPEMRRPTAANPIHTVGKKEVVFMIKLWAGIGAVQILLAGHSSCTMARAC
jgi:hypothetical protein